MKTILFFASFLVASSAFGQKYFTRTGEISFFSKAPLEDIEAHNKQVACIAEFGTGDVAFTVAMKSFQFQKALMQEHFNENYVESDKYPKAAFEGKIAEKIDVKKDGTYNVNVSGKLTIHGVSNNVQATGTVQVSQGVVVLKSTFNIKTADYKIEIPKAVKSNIAETIKITVNASCKPYKK